MTGTGERQYRFIAGLGNPGPEYERTRHNIGFLLLDSLLEGSRDGAPGGRGWREKDGAQTAEVVLEGQRVTLIKPLEFMNLSGGSIARLMQFVKADPQELIVAHDDIDLPFGSLRIRPDGGDGGHRGIRSIIGSLGADSFVRLKMGVGRPERGEVKDWVLERFSKQESDEMPEYLRRAQDALRVLLRDGVKAAQNKFNVRVRTTPGVAK
ncbi:MAG: aminoacyl-tRNA hydrolase [Proteobacteria bacterium]|nr:aminoacyl-tRNA hydrolase [Pseudomonadota bacterium]